MAYFNGRAGTDMNGRWHYTPMTALYCDPCAETAIPLPKKSKQRDPEVGRHWETGFKWAPHFGAECHKCKKPV